MPTQRLDYAGYEFALAKGFCRGLPKAGGGTAFI
jgi:hypothetical protein